MNVKKYILLLMCFSIATLIHSQIERIEPPNWWTGMVHNQVQLLIYGENISNTQLGISKYQGVTLDSIEFTINPNYAFLNLNINLETRPGTIYITSDNGKEGQMVPFELKKREHNENAHQGFDATDVIYLLMPDRFSNGDEANDDLNMKEGIDRNDEYGRHGGDLQGIINHMNYFDDLGVTALWLNPVFQNDMPKESYHGYAITDFYKVDERLGTNELYKQLVDSAHKKGLKVIKDMVVNHCGIEHWLINDLPSNDWVHQYDEFTRTNYRGVANVDPYVSSADLDLMRNGWFDHSMPDLNQQDAHLAKYLIQNTIWWIEYSGIDGIRMDTYSYPDKDFLSEWAEAVYAEYSNFNIVGEVWENKASTQQYWLSGANDAYDSHIDCITDFVLKESMTKAFQEGKGWDTGLSRVYYTLTEDRLYPNANELLTFLDNHDVPRAMSQFNGDLDKMKMALTLLLTTRGIPQLYYGVELGYEGYSHGEVRPEFDGGWADHKANAFTGKNILAEDLELQTFTRTLLNWRKKQGDFFEEAELTHYVPQEGIYVYFRTTDEKTVMIVLNETSEVKTISTGRFSDQLAGFKSGTSILKGEQLSTLKEISIPAKSSLIIELSQ